jgi:RND family efflux transporter MFP subunit
MKRLAWAAVSFGVVGSGIVVLGRAGFTQVKDPLDSAAIVRVARRNVGSVVKATGIIKPRVGAEVRVGSRVSGVVERLYVQIGDTVSKGQLLAELDDEDLIARRDEAAAALKQSEVDLTYAGTDLRRKRKLAAPGGISRSDLDLAEQAYAVAKQRVVGARANLAYASTQVGYARIVAPITGVVASIKTQEGETVAAGLEAPTFLTLLDPSRLEVWAYVDETDIGRIRVGQQAHFTVDTYGDQEFDGRTTAVHPQAEIRDNVVNYVTVVRFQPPRDRTLRPEMTTTIRITLELREGVLALPIRALHRQGARTYVFLPRGDKIERRWVTTGSRDESYWEIVGGLREGEEVLVGEVNPTRAPDS